jgi:hypothetical protein
MHKFVLYYAVGLTTRCAKENAPRFSKQGVRLNLCALNLIPDMEVAKYFILTIEKGGSRYSAAWYPSVNPSSSFVEIKRQIGVSQNSPW